jgi:hypothetical protein
MPRVADTQQTAFHGLSAPKAGYAGEGNATSATKIITIMSLVGS